MEGETSAVPFSTASLTWLSLQPSLCPRSFQNWRLWFSGVEQAGGQDGTGESGYQGRCFSDLNFHMLRGELQGPLLFAGHRDGRERSGQSVLGQRDLKQVGEVRQVPLRTEGTVCVVWRERAVGMRVIAAVGS